jgi:transcriptional regulator with XRE-family HTH domain
VNVTALKTAREREGWSQKTLAKAISCDPRVIERIESRGTASIHTLAKIAKALNVDPQLFRFSPTGQIATESFASRTFQLPAVVADFTGREDEIRRIGQRLRGGYGAVGVSALQGMGGVGKTSLAVRVAHEVKNDFPDGQLFLELQGLSELPITPTSVMSWIINAFQPGIAYMPNSEVELQPHYRSVLSGKHALVVLDNAADENQVAPLIKVPQPVCFLITSRRSLALDAIEPILIDGLPPNKALEMLRAILGRKGTDRELQSVAKLCAYLPLALRVAGDFLRLKQGWTVARYITALTKEPFRWLKVGTAPEKHVEAVLKLSSQQLVRDNTLLARRWHLLHFFPGDFDVAAAAAVWNTAEDEDTVLEQLSALAERSLVLFDPAMQRFRLHDLMRPIAKGLYG